VSSTAAKAWPELTPGAPCPIIFTAGRLLKRSILSGPELKVVVVIAESGTIAPDLLRT